MGTFYYITSLNTSTKNSSAKIYLSKGNALYLDGGKLTKSLRIFFITKTKANDVISSINKGANPPKIGRYEKDDFVLNSSVASKTISISNSPLNMVKEGIKLLQSELSLDNYLLSYDEASKNKDKIRVLFIYADSSSIGHIFVYDGPISELKRGEDFQIKKHTGSLYSTTDSTIKKTLTTFTCAANSSHVNGFFYGAGRYVNGSQFTKSGFYLAYSKSSKKDLWLDKPKNKEDAMAWGSNNDSSNAQLVELTSGANKKVGYKNVSWDGSNGSSGDDSSGSSGSISLSDDNSYDIDNASFPTERYASAENLIESYDPINGNAQLFFLGCQDSRTSKTIDDPLGNEYAQNKFYGGVSAHLTNTNIKTNISTGEREKSYLMLQPYVHREMAILGTIEEGVWKTDVTSSRTPGSSSGLISELDTLLNIDFSNEKRMWIGDLSNSNYPPYATAAQWILPMSDSELQHRTFPYIALIIPKSEEITVATEGDNWDISDIIKLKNKSISFYDYFNKTASERATYKIQYWLVSVSNHTPIYSILIESKPTLQGFLDSIMAVKRNIGLSNYTYEAYVSSEPNAINLYSLELFPAYTRGHDFIQEKYTTVRPSEQDSDGNRKMTFDDNYFEYKYTGRDIDIFQGSDDIFSLEEKGDKTYCALIHEKDLLLSSDVTLGETYGEQKYYIEAIKYPELNSSNERTGKYLYKDTFKVTDYLEEVGNTKYVKDDLEIIPNQIDLSKCEFYNSTAATYENHWCDCCYNSGEKGEFKQECYYQKVGKCPYRFQTEKHPRRIRTLKQSKSNRFNLIQELSKTFEFYPYFYIEYEKNGKVKTDENGHPKKHVLFMTEKGSEKYAGFRYEKNLSSVSRDINSDSLTTRLIVEPVDSELTATGLCSIALATDNISRENSIYNFSYYVNKGLLDAEQVQRDLYGIEKDDLAYITRVGNYNRMYDNYSNLIITMTGDMLTKLQAELEVYTTGVGTALEERQKKSQQMYQFKQQAEKALANVTATTAKSAAALTNVKDYTTSDTYLSYLQSYRNLTTELFSNVETLFYSNNNFCAVDIDDNDELIQILYNFEDDDSVTLRSTTIDLAAARKKYCKGEFFFRLEIEGFEEYPTYSPPFDTWEEFSEKVVADKLYKTNGKLGQYNSLYGQVKYWKLQRAKILNKINSLYQEFYQKYESFIKEGTWTESNYLTDNSYYWAANDVLNDSCKPQVSYSFNVVDISPLEEYADDYTFELADTTYLEDIDFFDINKKTGLPNRQKVLISEIEYHLDEPQQNNITVQNYTSQFDDLFGAISASVQSLTFNENMYKRAANFTPHQYVQAEALQGTLDEGDLTLIDANDENVVIDDSGAKGKNITNVSSQYDLNGQGLFFSNDGGNTWDIGVGPKGINMDYAKFGSLDASKVQIVDGNYIYFLWDKNGINAYRDPSASTSGLVDFARFNKYGLSLIENNNVRLRAGYAFHSTANTGDYQTEAELTNQNVGFYLYNDKGQAIFKTETASSYSKAANPSNYTARLSLDGEMFVTNTVLEDEKESYSVLSASLGNQLTNALNLKDLEVDELIENSIFSRSDFDIGFLENVFYICFADEEITLVTDNVNSTITTINVDRIVAYNPSGKTIKTGSGYTLDTNNALVTKSWSFIERKYQTDKYIGSSGSSINDYISSATKSSSNLVINTYENEDNEIKEVVQNTVKVISSHNTSAYTNISTSATSSSITYYDLSENSPYMPITNNLYNYMAAFDGVLYNYWLGYGEGASVITNSTESTIDQIGIWINNKIPSNSVDNNDTALSNVAENDESEEETEESTIEQAITADETITSKICDLDTMYFVGDSITEGWNLKSSTFTNSELKAFTSRMIGFGGKGFMGSTDFIKNKIPTNATHVAFNFGINGFSSSSDVKKAIIQSKYTELIQAAIQGRENVSQIYIVSPIYAPENSTEGNTKVGEYLDDVREALMSIEWGQINNIPVTTVDIWEVTKEGSNVSNVHNNDASKNVPAVYNTINSIGGTSGTSITISDNVNEDAEAAVAQLNKGAERIFLIGAKTDKSYRNILSVLKNGSLFIGGEIRDEMGAQIQTQFEYMPDKIKVINPQITMSIDGFMWCDWSKFFNIGYDSNGNLLYQVNNSLADYLNSISGGGSGSDSSKGNGLTGYYFVDPI